MAEHPIDKKKSKLPLELIPPIATVECAIALAEGAYNKPMPYGPWSWRDNEVSYMSLVGAMLRHINKIISRNDYDNDIASHNLGNVMACCAIIMDAEICGMLIDDRPDKVELVLDRMEKYRNRVLEQETTNQAAPPADQ